MSSVCPGCGVAVVPGYVRCPKCHAALPIGAAAMATTTGRIRRVDPGGTAVPERGFPFTPVLIGLGVIVAMILVFGTRGSKVKAEAEVAAAIPDPVPATPLQVPAARPAPRPVTATEPAAAPSGPTIADVGAASRALEAALRQARLWGRVDIAGGRVDVRSGSCGDRTMRPTIDGQAALLHGAGLTKLRCVEQSGAVVFERDL